VQSTARINQLNLLHRTKTKLDMLKTVSNQSPLCQSRRNREDLRWEGFVKDVGFEPEVKEWRSYGWWEWWIYGKSWIDACRKIRVEDGETGMRLSERSRELRLKENWIHSWKTQQQVYNKKLQVKIILLLCTYSHKTLTYWVTQQCHLNTRRTGLLAIW